MEDLLTSDVFGACKYMRPETLLIPFLHTATSVQGSELGSLVPPSIESVEYLFWPLLAHSEPDLLLILTDDQHDLHLVMVEAKYLSGKSGDALGDDDLAAAIAPSDQLAREYQDLNMLEDILVLDPRSVQSRLLVYVTAHRSIPSESLAASEREIAHFEIGEPMAPLFWTSWFELAGLIPTIHPNDEREALVIEDLRALLDRKRFNAFQGFRHDAAVPNLSTGAVYFSASRAKSGKYNFLVAPVMLIEGFLFGTRRRERSQYLWKVELIQRIAGLYS